MVERARRADQFSSRVGIALMPHPDVVIRFLAMPPLLSRIGIASVPYAVAAPFVDDGAPPLGPKTHAWAALGVATLVGALALVALSTTRRLPLAALALLAPCWSLAMPSNWVQFEALFAVGVPLALFALALIRVGNAKLKRLAGIAAAPAFALSSFLMAEASHDPARAERNRALAADFESIHKLTAGKAIFFEQPQGTIGLSRRRYFLPDSIFAVPAARRFADFIASDRPVVGVPSLTPNNRRLFLYDRIDCDAGTKAGDAVAAPAHRKPPSS